ncbi:MAG: Demethylmenaquinone methyltransferase [Candidatus Magasanikbacteria bacterium GW2011_GWC2_37_14]|uniref:Demethylmenaquinone methyltransferase n=1 Tax=Candidatus Magasanikbacteria bacterium GW2011_GWC2_37_14 TaxID=1619046 RepID=A0A0G0GE43_9BACT|nr:MAG: Demethylmenaquinone methyltransferase [Candidatus Magasanikbacteria bacterium GW2011_GWC2_37_14]
MVKVKVLNSKDGYNILADYYAKKEKYWDSFEKDQVLPLLGEVKNKQILDVGAGNGRLSLKLAKLGAEVTSLDVSNEMLNKLKIKKLKLKITTVIGEAENLLFDNDSFDIVVATFLIVHLKDLRMFFNEVYRVLKPGGLFLVTNINQRKAPEIKVNKDLIEVESYYHRPEQVIEDLEELAFSVEQEKFVKEEDVWINQIILAKK